jgi:hypothetical protein
VIGRVLRDRVEEEQAAGRARGDEREDQEPMRLRQDFPTTS